MTLHDVTERTITIRCSCGWSVSGLNTPTDQAAAASNRHSATPRTNFTPCLLNPAEDPAMTDKQPSSCA